MRWSHPERTGVRRSTREGPEGVGAAALVPTESVAAAEEVGISGLLSAYPFKA
ncbi:hypothetical protein GCM10010276_88100 [Streptomyces longisporus]|uniref:Uncharacterized protein n=1 Tax=Streptomyces longisporus TaxID=1948 RepID=A0ABP6AU52_STRLO